MTIFKEYHNYDGIGIAKLIKSKEVSIEDVLETAIDSLTKNNSKNLDKKIKLPELKKVNV